MVAVFEGGLPDVLTVAVLELPDHLDCGIVEDPYGVPAVCTLEGAEEVDDLISGDGLVA